MSDLQRLQQLAKPLNWKIEEAEMKGYLLYITSHEWFETLAPIAARLEAEYRKLAEQHQATFDTYMKCIEAETLTPAACRYFTRIADELAVKEPTEYKPIYQYDSKLIADWEKQTGLKWDNKRADTFLDLLGFPLGCEPYNHLKDMERAHDKRAQEPTMVESECSGRYKILHKIALLIYPQCPVCGESDAIERKEK